MFKNRKEYLELRAGLIAEAQNLIDEGKLEDGTAKMDEVKELDNKYEAYAEMQANLNALNNLPAGSVLSAAMGAGNPERLVPELTDDMYDTVEYRRAFMNNVVYGEAIPSKFTNADANTKTTDVGTVIPTSIMNRIVEKLESVGKIYSKVTHTFYKGGLSIPTSSAKPTATWVAEGAGSDKQKKTTGSITFAYYKLRCAISMSLETTVVTLDIFETTFVNNVVEAMIKAIEKAIFTGTGSTGKQPTGFLTETVVTGQNVDIAKTAAIKYADLCKMEAALPEEYEADAEWFMRKTTFFNQIVGMVDADGQPIARINYGLAGKPEYMLFGRPVNFTNHMEAYADTVSADTIVACIFNLKDYLLNINLDMTVKQYEDNDTDDQVTKAIMLVDGKTVDKNSLVTMTKKSA